jgi:ABC-type nitrate/sulfonate/bicarbonate transport system substrate-binding protein
MKDGIMSFKITSLAFVLGMALAAPALAQNRPVVVGVAPSPDNALLIVAVNGGFLAKEGLVPELKLFDSSPQALQAVVSRQADVTMNTEPPQLGARARGAKIVQVLTGWISGRNAAGVVAGGIAKPADLAGKTVATQRGSGSNYHLVTFLAKYDLRDKVTVRYLDAPDQVPALARGDIQGFFSWEPFVSRSTQMISNAKVLTWAGDDGVFFQDNVIMREEFVKENKDVAVRVVRGLIAAADWMEANRQEAAKVANAVLKAPSDEQALHDLQLFKFTGELRKSLVEHERKLAAWSVSVRLFQTPDPVKLVDDLVYPDIIKAAAPARTDF